ncbi:MAG: PspC domain-containing protein [Vicingaceae bacterium]
MNKTVTANISGVVFHIEADAYEKLHQYLNTIRNYFHDSDGKDEIMADIEARIAELFSQALEEGREVVTMANVKQVIEIMGEPEAYMSDPDEEESAKSTHNTRSKSEKFYSKKLYRDEDDNLIGGVCSGIGYYFGIDKIWLRAAFLIAFFGFGTGLLVYIILWIIIPSAKTTAEKLEMKGEPINVDSIGNAIKDEFHSFKKKVNNGDASEYGHKAKHGIYRFFEFLGKVLYYAAYFIIKFLAVILVLAATLGLIAFITLLLGGPFDLSIHNSEIDQYWLSEYGNLFFSSNLMYSLGLLGVCLVVIIPILGLLYGGLKILFKIPSSNKAVGLTAISLWVIGIILMVISGSSTGSQFSSEQTFIETQSLPNITSDTISLKALGQEHGMLKEGDDFFIEGESLFLDALSVDVVKSESNEVELYIRKQSRGPSRKKAGQLAQNVKIIYEATDHELLFNELIEVPVEDKYRDQEVEVSIGLPIGKSIYLTETANWFIYDIENVSNTYDGKMIGHHWIMTAEGLSCQDCEWLNKPERLEQDLEAEEALLREAELIQKEAEKLQREAEKKAIEAERLLRNTN